MMKSIDFAPGYIHRYADVTDEPTASIEDWTVITALHADGTRTRQLLGRYAFEGRFSSALVAIDWKRSRARTHSGRVYEMVGPPGKHEDAYWICRNALRVRGQTLLRDHFRAIQRLLKKQNGQDAEPVNRNCLHRQDVELPEKS